MTWFRWTLVSAFILSQAFICIASLKFYSLDVSPCLVLLRQEFFIERDSPTRWNKKDWLNTKVDEVIPTEVGDP